MTNKKYFCGNEISQYGIENGYVDYRALAKSFDAVLNNSIIENTYNIGYWEQVSGFIDNSDEQDEQQEIFQYYIVSDQGAEILKDANEILFYNNNLDMYVWGVTHYGTAWDYVLTNIKIDW